MTGLGNRVHIFAHPRFREDLIEFFTNTLGCQIVSTPGAASLPVSIVAFLFTNGASLSVEFTEDALDESQARRAAYLEIESDDPDALKQRIIEAGLPKVQYFGTGYFYFAAPGGQVMRIAPIRQTEV